MVVTHSELTVLRCSSGTIATCLVFPNKQSFAGKCFVHEQLLLDLTDLEIPIQLLIRANRDSSSVTLS